MLLIKFIPFAFFAVASAFLLPLFHSQSPLLSPKKTETISRNDFDVWLNQQTGIAFDHILDNIGGISTNLDENEVSEGVVIASPSKQNPNYFYQWTRDSALTIRSLIYRLQDSDFSDTKLLEIIESYIVNNYHLQRLPNFLGAFDPENNEFSGLGEPKFHPNLTTFDEKWGRPQRDGPGLRASTIGLYLSLLDKLNLEPQKKFLTSKSFIYTEIVRPDLHYIVENWSAPGFDLWEEINSIHFFTSMTQLRALKDGIHLCNKFEEGGKEFCDTLSKTFDDLKEFVTDKSGFIQASSSHLIECPELYNDGKRSGLDAATFLGVLHARSLESQTLVEQYADIPFDISNSYVLNSFRAMVSDMKYRYSINRYRPGWGVAVGRYPEDIYDGYGTTEGNPWFICTATLAELMYRMVYKMNEYQEPVIITKDVRDFYSQFMDIYEEDDTITIPYGSDEHHRLSLNLVSYADSFLEVVKDHVDDTGRMSEQFNKYSGYMQGAEDLTWSYSAVWNCIRWRTKAEKLIPV